MKLRELRHGHVSSVASSIELLYGFGALPGWHVNDEGHSRLFFGTPAVLVRYGTGSLFCDVEDTSRCLFTESIQCTTSQMLAGHMSSPLDGTRTV